MALGSRTASATCCNMRPTLLGARRMARKRRARSRSSVPRRSKSSTLSARPSTLLHLRPACGYSQPMLTQALAFVGTVLMGALLSGCSSSSQPSATLLFITGQETDAFTRGPVPVRLDIRSVSFSGTKQLVTSVPWPASAFDLGDFPMDQIAAFEAIGLDAASTPVVRGQTLPMDLSQLGGAQIPLFMGRIGEMARPPGALPLGRTGGVTAMIDAHYWVVAGGSSVVDASGAAQTGASLAAYDVGTCKPLSDPVLLPRSPSSIATIQDHLALLIDSQGATWVDFDTPGTTDVSAPPGMSFADIAGAVPIMADDATIYLVGACRSDTTPSAAVLHIAADQTLSASWLSSPRSSAACAWIKDRGLVVAAGSSSAAGVEVLAKGSSTFAALNFAPDATAGAAAAPLDDRQLLLAGGLSADGQPAQPRIVDVSCSSNCAPLALTPTGTPFELRDGLLVALSQSDALLVGTTLPGASNPGQTAVMRLSISGQQLSGLTVPLREPRSGAVAAQLPNGMVAVVGGLSDSGAAVRNIEMFIGP
jgi:hypothetical protein